MNVIVIYKWARDPDDAVLRSSGSVDWRGAKMVAGDDDPAAVVAGCAIAAALGCSVVGLTIGDGDVSWALARGIEKVVTVPDAPRFSDDAATATLLAAAIRWVGDVDLVVIGDAQSYPGVPAALSGILGWPTVLGASAAAVVAGRLVATRRLDGSDQTVSTSLPALVAVAAEAAERQPPGMRAIIAARKRPIATVSIAELGIDARDRLQLRRAREPDFGSAQIFRGSTAVAARELVSALHADGVL